MLQFVWFVCPSGAGVEAKIHADIHFVSYGRPFQRNVKLEFHY